jgi:hypothetical protein
MTALQPLVAPVVNMNGTSREELARQYLGVMRALEAANTALCVAMPNGRDYQTVDRDGTACRDARQAFYDRCEIITRMRGEFEAVAIALMDEAA